jgi:predicted RNA-binding Zn-ribbon protein involved in translation (DUF1610 family)
MSENQKFCPKCGTANKADAKFCRSCREKFAAAGSLTTETMQKAADVANTVASTVSKVGSAVSTAGKIAQTAGELSQVVIRPPAEWKVVVGDMLPVAGQRMVESAVVTAETHVQQQVQQKVQEEVTRRVSDMVSKKVPEPPESLVPVTQSYQPQPSAPQPSSSVVTCPSCGNLLKSGAKFCNSCGSVLAGTPKTVSVTVCPSCGKPLTPGKKFCRSCGNKLG